MSTRKIVGMYTCRTVDMFWRFRKRLTGYADRHPAPGRVRSDARGRVYQRSCFRKNGARAGENSACGARVVESSLESLFDQFKLHPSGKANVSNRKALLQFHLVA